MICYYLRFRAPTCGGIARAVEHKECQCKVWHNHAEMVSRICSSCNGAIFNDPNEKPYRVEA